jgi:hypothetical protein
MPPEDTIRIVRIGCRGWQDTPWSAGYYPEDLPEEWRLAYYANEADCVLLPAGVWADVPAGTLADWAAEVDVRFRFYLETQGAAPGPGVRGALGERLGGWLGDGGGMHEVPVPQGRAWAAGRRALVRLGGDRDLRAWRTAFESLRGWMGPYAEVALIPGSEASPRRVRELRTLVELLGL